MKTTPPPRAGRCSGRTHHPQQETLSPPPVGGTAHPTADTASIPGAGTTRRARFGGTPMLAGWLSALVLGGMFAGQTETVAAPADPPPLKLDLAGEWQFAMDPGDQGIDQGWFRRDLEGRIELPASMAERGLGEDIRVDTPWTGSIVDRSFFTDPRYAPYRQPGRVKVPFWLTPRKYYVGPAWYRRPVDVLESWRNQRLVLRLERPHWGTTVWWDDRRLGSQDSLSTPHVYELPPGVTPGRHWLTVRVDNRMLVPVGRNSHSISDHTQGNWNGIVGRLELLATPPVWIEDLQVFPDVTRRAVRVRLKFGNRTGREAGAVLRLEARSETPPPHEPPPVEKELRILPVGDVAEVELPLGPDARLWDEFAPNVYRLTATLLPGNDPGARHQVQTTFGLREIGREGTQFTINGRRTFLRGTLECCVFPLTGHPPTDVDSWRRVFRVCRAHGLNHMRFHSWCPPEAAFQAADELGFYLHVECASWANSGTSLDDPKVRAFLMREADRILRAYGNHPSFCFLAYGNEPAGRVQREWLGRFVTLWRQADPRRLYTSAAGWPIIPENDYHVTPTPRIQAWGAGLNSRINARPPETVTDYGDFIRRYEVPVVSHESANGACTRT